MMKGIIVHLVVLEVYTVVQVVRLVVLSTTFLLVIKTSRRVAQIRNVMDRMRVIIKMIIIMILLLIIVTLTVTVKEVKVKGNPTIRTNMNMKVNIITVIVKVKQESVRVI